MSLPSQRDTLEQFWWGSQYIAGSMTPSGRSPSAGPLRCRRPGCTGVTTDGPSWNGDYTLDYNQEAQYYGVHSSNHPELAAYCEPIWAWLPAARADAAVALSGERDG